MTKKNIYLQSPIDDIESFYNVFVWAIMHNEDSQEALVDRETEYRDELSGLFQFRVTAQKALLKETPIAPILSQLLGVMTAWDKIQVELQQKYNFIEGKYGQLVAKKTIGQGGIPEQVFWKWAWNLIAYEGVQRIVETIYSYRDVLTTYPSFKQE